ncbi:hypothetical protein M422DRAFT_32067 [Sphaerobolus stellatus SS14]|uniref:Unplaced genomic scaffold SPHSTscaffold_65, whole genome shotgun sequence n=1 Tax=Sphaerobolus stellatus (strain SS14) TaxID=990650 RepID=A0A0C9UCY1_SPHS4|nr:hypothetical protein M422DRAFT_32067 [Sphaerobolus stellatus SS14]
MQFLKKKNRLYLAYYDLGGTPDMMGDRYHTALLLAPKNPDPKLKQSWIFDVKSTMTLEGPEWELRCAETRNRNFQLAALVLLGRIPEEVGGRAIEGMLRGVPVPAMDENPEWMCQHWVWKAIQRLAGEKLIEKLPSTPEALWRLGRTFAEDSGTPDLKKAVPTCDMNGRSINSEVAPLES